MAREIFRQAALDRLAAPDRLDRPASLVRRRGWIALATVVAAVSSAVAWGASATAPVKVPAQGILIEEGVLADVAAAVPGRIVSLDLAVGQTVDNGDVIAVLARTDLQLDLDKTRADLADARARYVQLEQFYSANDVRELQAENARLETIAASQDHVTRRISLLGEKMDSINALLDRKLVIRDRLIETELDLATAREKLAQLDDDIRQIALRRLDRESKRRLALLDEKFKTDELQRRIERIEGQLAEETIVRSPHSGRVAEIKVNRGDVLSPGMSLATLVRDRAGEETAAEALVYVSARDGRRIEPGMPVEIVPTTIRKQEFGFARGEVTSVSDVAVTAEGMRNVLKNDQLVERLSGEGAPIALRVRLFADDATPSGLEWSSSQGPPNPIASGTLLDGQVVIERVRLITLLAPGLHRLFRSGDG